MLKRLRAFLVAVWCLTYVLRRHRYACDQMILTGSRVYGVPREYSDYDFVVLLPAWRATLLRYISDNPNGAVYFGLVNFIVETDGERFDKWRKITRELEERKPVTRDEAVAAFTAVGLTNNPDSPSNPMYKPMIGPAR